MRNSSYIKQTVIISLTKLKLLKKFILYTITLLTKVVVWPQKNDTVILQSSLIYMIQIHNRLQPFFCQEFSQTLTVITLETRTIDEPISKLLLVLYTSAEMVSDPLEHELSDVFLKVWETSFLESYRLLTLSGDLCKVASSMGNTIILLVWFSQLLCHLICGFAHQKLASGCYKVSRRNIKGVEVHVFRQNRSY